MHRHKITTEVVIHTDTKVEVNPRALGSQSGRSSGKKKEDIHVKDWDV